MCLAQGDEPTLHGLLVPAEFYSSGLCELRLYITLASERNLYWTEPELQRSVPPLVSSCHRKKGAVVFRRCAFIHNSPAYPYSAFCAKTCTPYPKYWGLIVYLPPSPSMVEASPGSDAYVSPHLGHFLQGVLDREKC